ncbi:GNAT family N-acetyltransferase [Priestia megaterium]|uniref:GNAT family N-acetyltransferase n=1 Tax=Priestia TaxID=2800373 RepID=UPI0005C51372|nr:GNAT family protein [Priestia megaterium]MCF8888720.1 GNAT family N-acetyltransferase [Priestia megaterium]NEW01397.1 GNAT family N-acetyltransferase [Priestia megaterium]NGY82612.1 GNAT family N-acetyltransferase [Priestia megaterium]
MSNYFPIIKTKRLTLREIVAEDAGSILKYLSDKEVMKHYGLEPFTTVEDASNEIAWYKSILNEKSGIRWGITLKEQDDIIGSCGFLNRVHNHYRAEIGYELSKDYWGNGIANEALGAVIKYGFTHFNLRRIEALIEPANTASQKLIKKHSFIKEGLLRSYEFTCGKFDDLYMYSLLKQDFDRLQPHEGNI